MITADLSHFFHRFVDQSGLNIKSIDDTHSICLNIKSIDDIHIPRAESPPIIITCVKSSEYVS